MYTTYITEALVCGSRNRNTYDRVFLLFTREAGMVWTSARSVRKEKSKQRYALQECSHIRASLISGRSGWRVAGVESLENLYFTAETRKARALVRNTIRLLRRTIQGESAQPELFDDVLASLTVCNHYDHEKLELILALRILHQLGYVSSDQAYAHIIDTKHAFDSVDTLDPAGIRLCRGAVDTALLSSQL